MPASRAISHFFLLKLAARRFPDFNEVPVGCDDVHVGAGLESSSYARSSRHAAEQADGHRGDVSTTAMTRRR
jgi:hypothetical protein